MKRVSEFSGILALVLVLALAAILVVMEVSAPAEEPVARGGYQCAVYTEQGCAKYIVASGGEIEVQSGGTIDIQSGATTDFSGGLDLDGALLDLDADGDTSLQSDTDDQIDVEIGASDIMVLKDWGASTITTDTTEHLFEIQDGAPIMTGGTNILSAFNIDMDIGNSTAGTNSVYGILIDTISQDAQNTETAIAIANGWDRGLDLDGNSIYLDNDQDTIIAEASDDVITLTPGSATGSFEVRTGNLQVGDGTPGETHNGEDFYVEGISEFDGNVYFDGAVDVDAAITGADDLEHVFFPTVASTAFTYTAAAGGTVALFTIGDGEIWLIHDIYVNVTTNFDCVADDCTVHIGDGGDEDGFCDLDDGELQTTDTEVTGAAAGWQCFASTDVIGAYITSGRGFIYAPSGAAETIDAVLAATGDDFSAGEATVYIVYTRIQ